MSPKKYKTPADYPLFSFRVSAKAEYEGKTTPTAIIKKFEADIKRIIKQKNANKSEDTQLWKKGDVVTQALIIGLRTMKKKI